MWSTVYEGPDKEPRRKGQIVVNIRGLNRMNILNNHPLPMQGDTACGARGCTHITVANCIGQFYLFRVRKGESNTFKKRVQITCLELKMG